MMKTYVFPGQGSQKKGMGVDLFDAFPELTKKADAILGYSIQTLCLNDPDHLLGQTQYTQPALYVVNALSYQKKIKETGKKPDFLAGHSLGEYNALNAAGVISFEDGLKLVKKRGELMSLAKDGGMAAILNATEAQILDILKQAGITTIDIANLNSPGQIVISGLKDDINKAQPFFTEANFMFIPLNTSGAFHSRYMKDAAKEYEKLVKKTKFSKPSIPVIANVTGKPYQFDKIAHNLVQQLSQCVRWTDTVMYLLAQGEMEIEELGVGDVLTKLTRYIKKEFDLKNNPSAQVAEGSNPEKPKELEAIKTAGSNEGKGKAEQKELKVAAAGPAPVNEKVQALNESSADKGNQVQSQKTEIKKFQQLEFSDIKEIVEQWNKTYPVGTRVLSDHYDSELETRTEATILFGHRAAVYMKGYNGYFDLKEVQPVARA